MTYETILEYIGLSGCSAPNIILCGVILLLVPYFPGKDFQFFKIPEVPHSKRKIVAIGGGIIVLIGLVSMVPMIPVYPATLSECGIYSDEYTKDNEWKCYDKSLDKDKPLWVSCKIDARSPVVVDTVRTQAGLSDYIFVGYREQKPLRSVALGKDQSVRIAVRIDPAQSLSKTESYFSTSSEFSVQLNNGDTLPAVTLPPVKDDCAK